MALETATNERAIFFLILTNERGCRVAHQTATIHVIHVGCIVAFQTKIYGELIFAYQKGLKVAHETAGIDKALFCIFCILTNERGCRVAHQTATIHIIQEGCIVASYTANTLSYIPEGFKSGT